MKFTLNLSREDVINNCQGIKKRNTYKLSDMAACMDVGQVRKNQEDSVLLLAHPNNEQFKLMAVADGMGGLSCGDVASNLALLEIIKWFEELPDKYYVSEREMYRELPMELDYIDEVIRANCQGGGTTISLMIASKYNTILVNAGDSRIYVTNGQDLHQVSVDHSISWDLYEKGEIIHKDDIRFHRRNHLILSRLGCEKKLLTINSVILGNSDYDKVLLFTDGVTDCLSDEQLQTVINSGGDITSKIVDMALTTNSFNSCLNKDDYYEQVQGGKDNTSVATLIKKYK